MSHIIFDQIISIENLYNAWNEFKKGKRHKADVQVFEFHLEDNLFKLHWMLKNGYYKHGAYQKFNINDPKPRVIHKASVQDRIVHHAIFKILYPMFDQTFIFDSYSCRNNKGTHKAVKRLNLFIKNVSRHYQESSFVLKCDISKFFNSIDHEILKTIISKKLDDQKAMKLINNIIDSYHTDNGKGVPLGNLTSQLFANIYMNKLDQFMKCTLGQKYYIRYTDDFVIVHNNYMYLNNLIPKIDAFLRDELELLLHPKKVEIRKMSQGVDFLGYVILPHHKLLRTKSKRRMCRKLDVKCKEYKESKIDRISLDQSIQSYYGMLKHCSSKDLKRKVNRIINNSLDH
jgi:retron-type reverse transcriptase